MNVVISSWFNRKTVCAQLKKSSAWAITQISPASVTPDLADTYSHLRPIFTLFLFYSIHCWLSTSAVSNAGFRLHNIIIIISQPNRRRVSARVRNENGRRARQSIISSCLVCHSGWHYVPTEGVACCNFFCTAANMGERGMMLLVAWGWTVKQRDSHSHFFSFILEARLPRCSLSRQEFMTLTV